MARTPGSGSIYQRSSDGRWVAQIENGYTTNGRRRYRTKMAATKTEANALLRQLQREQHQGITETSRTTVKTWTDEWLPRHAEHARPRVYATDASRVNRYILPTIGRRRLTDLTPADIRSVASAVTAAGQSSTTAHHVHGLLIRILKDADIEGHPVPGRLFRIPRPSTAPSDREALTIPQAAAVLDAAHRTPHAARWVAALLQGLRQGEALGLTWDAVDLDRGTIEIAWQLQELPLLEKGNPAAGYRLPPGVHVRALHGGYHLVPPKTKSGYRIVPLVPWMHAALTQWREQAPPNPWGLVWTGSDPRYDGGRIIPTSADADRREWARLQDAAGVRHPTGRRYTLHEARHTTATMLLELGVDPKVVITIMGHSSILSTDAYRHVSTTMARKALDQVAERLGLPPA
ncbi:tyrosine-type recombinase/integrase [Arsenicicoccus dermatophilus]|uniref:tyrosine-type recombinase/integrase n=1 Tax=Arsenicicoccus dermatophilus TaxID=1076331 RepID=UPI001F4CFBEE|nr:site-specific integrase [Arsenicicoccus dermatophilus]MCH8613426.1 site-specific integrase [Arsenicicoccus dermatophilus]